MWLDAKVTGFGADAFVSMGMSCAHLAFGFAVHLGASPIVFVGQDLAYAEDGAKSHSSGTVYDQLQITNHEKKIAVEGYYGNTVYSRETWVEFKNWFENEILRCGITAINCTEGGSRIRHTTQMPLRDMIAKYCVTPVDVGRVVRECPNYNPDEALIAARIREQREEIASIVEKTRQLAETLRNIDLQPWMSNKKLLSILDRMRKTDELSNWIHGHLLLLHLLQSFMTTTLIRFNKIEQELTYDNVAKNLQYQRDFVEVTLVALNKLLDILDQQTNAGSTAQADSTA
jgi:hypothetical protein